jgi:hypothetical protein
MSKELISSIEIDAPAPVVWQVLVDFDAFPTWNPFITSAQGPVQVGGRLTLRMQPVSGSAVTLRPTVVEVVEGHRLRWQGHLGVRGLFDADCLSWSRAVLPVHDLCSRSNSEACSCRSSSGRWTAAHCRRFTR